MRFGFFDDVAKEYVITTPKTPLPWINYLGNRDFFSLCSNTAGGYSFYRDAKLRRITRYRYNNVPTDQNGRHFYLRSDESGDFWNIGWQPAQVDLDHYICRHGLGYTIIESGKNEICARQQIFVPLDDACEINCITITNYSSSPQQMTLFSLVEFCLWNAVDDATNFQRNFNTGEVEIEHGGQILYHCTEYRERRNHYAFWSCNRPVDGFDTSRDAFCGPYRGFDCPAAVELGHCFNSIASGGAPVGVHQISLRLAPGEHQSIIFLLGYAENPLEEKWTAPNILNKSRARELFTKYASKPQVDVAFRALSEYWTSLLGQFHLESGNAKLDRMVNVWNQYQCMVTFNMSRSASYFESGTGRGMGCRDSCQDILGFVHLIPSRARQRILDISATQFKDGSVYHQYQPLTKKGNLEVGSGFNDDPLWLIAAVTAYLRETGDFSILDEPVPFDNGNVPPQPLMDHIRRSFCYTKEHLGPHGLPLIGRADWNDCLNLNCYSQQSGESFQTVTNIEGNTAESIFIAGMFVKYGGEYAELCAYLGQIQEADDARQAVKEMGDRILSSGWDGDWFLRAYDANGDPVGSKSCDEGQIFIEPQGMCVMAGVGVENGFASKALLSVGARLETQYGIVLHQPAYTSYRLNLGEISSYPPGYKENAGIFCHSNPWISCAEAVLGHGTRAFDIYCKICPAFLEEVSAIHRTEPYVYSQLIVGKDAPTFGEAKNSWLTGTAAWAFVNISQYILGICPTLNGLKINPCIPPHIMHYQVTRRYRNAVYKITVQNPYGVEHGVASITVDGSPIPHTLLPIAPAGSVVTVCVVMG